MSARAVELVFVTEWSVKARLIGWQFNRDPKKMGGASHAYIWVRTIPRKAVNAKTLRKTVLGITEEQ